MSSCGYVTFDFYIIGWVSMYRNAFMTFQVGSKFGLAGEDRRTKSGLLWAKWDVLNLSFLSLYVGTPAVCHVAEWYAVPYRYKASPAFLPTSYSQTRFLGSNHGAIRCAVFHAVVRRVRISTYGSLRKSLRQFVRARQEGFCFGLHKIWY